MLLNLGVPIVGPLFTLALGMSWGIGSVATIFYNGVMLGAVAALRPHPALRPRPDLGAAGRLELAPYCRGTWGRASGGEHCGGTWDWTLSSKLAQ